MPNWACTLFMEQGGTGWEETYVTDDRDINTALAGQINQLIQVRLRMMYEATGISGLRVSDASNINAVGTPRSSQIFYPDGGFLFNSEAQIVLPAKGTFVPVDGAGPETIVRNSLQARVLFGSTQQTMRYFSPIPRGIVGTEPEGLNWGGAGDWGTPWWNFKSFMRSGGWTIRSLDKRPVSNPALRITGITQDNATPPHLQLKVQGVTDIGLKEGDTIHVYNTRAPKRTRGPTINGTWTVYSVTVAPGAFSSYVALVNSEAVTPAMVRYTAKSYVRAVKYIFNPIQDVVAHKVTPHKRGRPSLAPRGRRLILPNLDP